MTTSRSTGRLSAVRVAAGLAVVTLALAACDSVDEPTNMPLAGTEVSDVPAPPMSSARPTTAAQAPATTAPTAPTADTAATAAPAVTDRDDIVAHPPARSWQEALAAARATFDGEVVKIELEPEDGMLEYTVELYSATQRFTADYDANTLAERSSKIKDLDGDTDRTRIFSMDDVIPPEDAAAIARDQQDGAIVEWKIEGKDHGRVRYEFDILPPGAHDDVEVTIDAITGDIIRD